MNRQSDQNLITPQAADLLISRRDGDMTLLYLYLCRTGCRDREQASRDLFMPSQRLNEAYERLEMCGLSPSAASEDEPRSTVQQSAGLPVIHGSDTPPAVDEVPDYTAEEVKAFAERDDIFKTIVKEARLIIGRHLSSQDLIRLLGIYDHLPLSAEAVMELMHFVADVYREKYGERRRPSVHAFELEARLWAERGITDFDAAEQYMRSYRERRSILGHVKEVMDVVSRDFTDTERRYVEAWLDMGFGPEAIGLAYDKTLTNTRKFSPAYMNRILLNWHEKGLHTLAEIEAKDIPENSPPARGKAPSDKPVPSHDPDHIRGLVEKI